MATGNLVQYSGGPGELLKAQLQIVGGNPALVGGGDYDLTKAILQQMQTWPAPDIASIALQPTGCTASTLDRSSTAFNQTTAIGATGVLQLCAIFVPFNTIVNNINFVTGSTAGVTMTHQWAVLCDNNRNLLANTADLTNGAIGANAVFTWPVAAIASGAATSFTTTYGGLYYVGLLVTAATIPTLMGTSDAANTIKNIAPILVGGSTSSLTTPSPYPTQYAALTATTSPFYSYLT